MVLSIALLAWAAAVVLLAPPVSAYPYPTFEQPPWHLGFSWNYSVEGQRSPDIEGFSVNYIRGTTNISIVGETSTPRGDAWVVFQTSSGYMRGTVLLAEIRTLSEVNYTIDTWLLYRKSDLAVLNWTQDSDTETTIEGYPSVQRTGHNETVASPPLLEIPWGAYIADRPWRVRTALTSAGWTEVDGAGRVNSSTTEEIDYNATAALEVGDSSPSPIHIDAYRIRAYGSRMVNGLRADYYEEYTWAPEAQQRLRDEVGLDLETFYVDWPPKARDPPMVISVEAGSYNDTVMQLSYVQYSRGQVYSTSCQLQSPGSCTIESNGTINVSAPAGYNTTLLGNVTATDGFPLGEFTQPLIVLVRGPGNTNAPPNFTHGYYFNTTEDTDFVGSAADFFEDPDGDPMWVFAWPCQGYYIMHQDFQTFTSRTDAHQTPSFCLIVYAFDTSGNQAYGIMSGLITGVNDPPIPLPLGPRTLYVHAGGDVTANVGFDDPDGGSTLTYNWSLDGLTLAADAYGNRRAYHAGASDFGAHTLSVVISDGEYDGPALNFTIIVYDGPDIVSTDPPEGLFRVGSGTTRNFTAIVLDRDSQTLYYQWLSPAGVIGQGVGLSTFPVTFSGEGFALLRLVVSDNASYDIVDWTAFIEVAPKGLASIASPLNATEVDENTTVELRAAVDSSLAGATFAWRIDGTSVGGDRNMTSPPLQRGPHNITLTVAGLFNATAPYNETFHVTIYALQPAPASNGTGNNTGGGRPLVSGGTLLFLGVAAAAVAAVAAFAIRRRGKRAP